MTKRPYPLHRAEVPSKLFPPKVCGTVNGHVNKLGNPCGAYVVPGTNGCKDHGGFTPQSVNMALTRVQSGLIRSRAEQMVDYAESRGKNPADILMDAVWRLDAFMIACGELVAATADETGAPVPAIMREYVLALEAVGKMAAKAKDQNLDEAKFRLSMAQSDLRRIGQWVMESVRDPRLGLSAETQELFLSILAERMREGGLV